MMEIFTRWKTDIGYADFGKCISHLLKIILLKDGKCTK